MLTDHATGFAKYLDENPTDWDARLAYADFLEEQWAEKGICWDAVAQRYMGTMEVAPNVNRWVSTEWHKRSTFSTSYDQSCTIEHPLLEMMLMAYDAPNQEASRIVTPKNRKEAEKRLATALRLYHGAMQLWNGGSGPVPKEVAVCPVCSKDMIIAKPLYPPKSPKHGRPTSVRLMLACLCKDNFRKSDPIQPNWRADRPAVLRWAQTPDPESATFEFLSRLCLNT